jgi:hypothetical protein
MLVCCEEKVSLQPYRHFLSPLIRASVRIYHLDVDVVLVFMSGLPPGKPPCEAGFDHGE